MLLLSKARCVGGTRRAFQHAIAGAPSRNRIRGGLHSGSQYDRPRNLSVGGFAVHFGMLSIRTTPSGGKRALSIAHSAR